MEIERGNLMTRVFMVIGLVCIVLIFSVEAELIEKDQVLSGDAELDFSVSNYTFPVREINHLEFETSQDNEKIQVPQSVKKYELVTFDQTKINNDIRSPVHNLSFRISSTEYYTHLVRMDFDTLDDGIDSYSGTLIGKENSSVLLTVSEDVMVGSITLDDETYYIEPVNLLLAEPASQDLRTHIIYRSGDVEGREFSFENGTAELPRQQNLVKSEAVGSNTIESIPDGRTVITILVVTDNQFYSDTGGTGWIVVAQDIIAEANRQLGRNDIGVILVPQYDSARRQDLSNYEYHNTKPLVTFDTYYDDDVLNERSADLGLYIGGYDCIGTDGDAQGLSYIYGNSTHPSHGRRAWAQMVPDYSLGLYFGSVAGRRSVSIHEIGHMLGAGHEDSNDPPYYNRAYQFPAINPQYRTVMWSTYIPDVNLCEFSSALYNGNETHNNAKRIHDETKNVVSGYAGCSESPPSADFTWTPNPPPGSNPVFQKIVFQIAYPPMNNPTYYFWDFGDGSSSSLETPEWSYNWAGTYTVNLTAGNCAGSSTTSKEITITPVSSIVSGSGTPTSGYAPLTVQFSSQGSNPTPTSWNWSFGDGKFSESAEPFHEYSESGTFTVTLNVVQDGVENTKNFPDYISVDPQPPHADFNASTTSGLAPHLVQFTDTSTNDPGTWFWTFGDGGTSALQNPSHQYLTNGTFTVSLTATNPTSGSSTKTKTNYIAVGPLYAGTFGNYTILEFNTTGSTVWTPPAGVTKVDYLVVAGGGEGGAGSTYNGNEYISAGGGGGGGVLNGSNYPVTGPQTIVVGAGGSGSATGCGNNGEDSSFGNISYKITAKGGGGGSGYVNGYGYAAQAGGSGGGGSGTGSAGGNNLSGQGFPGGYGTYGAGWPGGGGGGAGTAGEPGISEGGKGGDGRSIDITGTSVYYGGGGGGGIGSWADYGWGGAGCGADGSRGQPNNAKCEGTGGGGGGAGGGVSGHGSGGSGVVIIRYLTPGDTEPVASFTASPTYGTAPLTVQFTDTSTGSPTGWSWDFGDGDATNATERNPVHTYLTNGTFTVQLNAINSGGSDTMTKVRFIKVGMQDKIGVFRDGAWYLDVLGNGNGGTSQIIYFGIPGDQAVSGDWNDDGKDEVGVYRDGAWYLDVLGNGNGGSSQIIYFGIPGDQAMPGDWNGDGVDEVGVYRNGGWYLDYNGNGIWDDESHIIWFGLAGDQAVSGDWNGDGKEKVGVYRNGEWYIDYNGNGIWDGVDASHLVWFGLAGDQAETGKW